MKMFQETIRMIIFDLLILSGYIAFFVTHEYLWRKEHNDLMLFYLFLISKRVSAILDFQILQNIMHYWE